MNIELLLKKTIADLLSINIEQLNENYNLSADKNWDSLTKLTIAAFITEQTGNQIPQEDLSKIEYLKDIRKYL